MTSTNDMSLSHQSASNIDATHEDRASAIVLNGAPVATHCTNLLDLLRAEGVDHERRGIAIAVNDKVIRRSDWGAERIAEGDRIEIITALQGG